MQKWPSIQWSNTYLPRGMAKQITGGEPGITVSAPVTDSDGKFKAVIGINLSLKFLSNFITHQRIGVTGKAFVLDSQGNLLVPTHNNLDSTSQGIAQNIITPAFQQFAVSRQDPFFDGIREG